MPALVDVHNVQITTGAVVANVIQPWLYWPVIVNSSIAKSEARSAIATIDTVAAAARYSPLRCCRIDNNSPGSASQITANMVVMNVNERLPTYPNNSHPIEF